MFAKGTDKHPHWDSALRRFADSVEMKIVAEAKHIVEEVVTAFLSE